MQGTNATAYVPRGNWGSSTTGVAVVSIETSSGLGTGAPATLIATPHVANSCSSNSATGQTVCVANNTDVYLINGTTLASTLTSGATTTQRDVHVDQCPSFTQDPLGSHFGGTPLYDAINAMGRYFREKNPDRAAATIVTDGEDNGSQFTTLDQARKILDWMRARGWQITFIGANINSDRIAGLLGGNPETAIGVQTRLLSDAAKNLAEKRARYGLHGTPMHFSQDEKSQFGGHLTDQTTKD